MICCQPEIADDVISGRNVKTVEGYVAYVLSSSSFRDFPTFCDDEGGSGSTNAICSRPEVADDIIYGESVETFPDFIDVSLWFASLNSF